MQRAGRSAPGAEPLGRNVLGMLGVGEEGQRGRSEQVRKGTRAMRSASRGHRKQGIGNAR